MSETARTGRLSGRPGRGLIWAILGLFCLVNLALLVRSYDGSIGSDYLFFYSGVVGAHLDGFRHLYDPVSQQKGLPPGYPQAVWAFAYPPLMAVLVWPFAYLPFWPSYFAWMAFQFASWLFAWRILAPETRSLRRMWLLALFAVYAVTFGLRMGQSDGYIAACVAGAWALTGRGRPYLAGFALALASVKPHLTWLIPVALVLVGERRVLLGWMASIAVIYGILVVILGPEGLGQAAAALHLDVAARTGPFSIPTLFGHSTAGWLVDLALVGVAVVLIRRHPSREVAFVVGLLLSSLTFTYLLYQDVALVIPVAWLWLRAFPGERDGKLFAFGLWLIALASLVATTVPIAETIWLLVALGWSLGWIGSRGSAPESWPGPDDGDVSSATARFRTGSP